MLFRCNEYRADDFRVFGFRVGADHQLVIEVYNERDLLLFGDDMLLELALECLDVIGGFVADEMFDGPPSECAVR